MNWLTSRGASLAAVAALALATASCDTGTALNVDLPDTSAVNTDYLDLAVANGTVRLAPVQTQKTDHFMVGRLTDNVAGTTQASAFFNVIDASGVASALAASGSAASDSLPSSIATTQFPAQLDSVVLAMGFDRVYGSSTTPVRFDVYKLTDPLDERQSYDAGSLTPTPSTNLLGQNLTSRLDRTQTQIITAAVPADGTTPAVPAVTTTTPDQTVRLVLQRVASPGKPAVNSSFATDLFRELGSANFGQTQLTRVLKGLAVTPNIGHTTSIVNFSRSYKSRLIVYFHADASRRSYSIYFGPAFSALGYSTARDPRFYTRITNDNLPPVLANLSTRAGFVPSDVLNNTSYVQEGVGLSTRITLPNLSQLIGQTAGLTINRAEILVPIKPFTNALYPNPNQLYAVEVDANNNVLQRTVNNIPTDRVVQGDGADQLSAGIPATGVLTNLSTTQPYYSIPVTSYLDAYLKNKLGVPASYLVLTPNIQSTATLSLNRAALDAAGIKLRIYYSKR